MDIECKTRFCRFEFLKELNRRIKYKVVVLAKHDFKIP